MLVYVAARDQGFPFDAIPVFLHRRFRHRIIFINTTKGITKPTDLIGRKVGLKQYQSSAILWLRGLLKHEYGVPFKSIDWYTELAEAIEFTPPPGLRLTRIADDKSIETMLAEGEIDALIHPDLITPLMNKDPRVGRLFPNYKEEEIAFYKRTRDLPDHACRRAEARHCGSAPLGSDQPLSRLQRRQGSGDEAHGEPAHRAARLVP